MTNALVILLLIAAIYLVVSSPSKWQTSGRMVVSFVTVLLLSIIGSAFLRMGDPEVWGVVGRLAGLLLAVFLGWRHTRSLSRARSGAPEQPSPNDHPAASHGQ